MSVNLSCGSVSAAKDMNQAENDFKSPPCKHREIGNDTRNKRRFPRRQFARSNSNSDAETNDRDSGCALEEYTWVPPNLTPDQVRIIIEMNHFIFYSYHLFHEIFQQFIPNKLMNRNTVFQEKNSKNFAFSFFPNKTVTLEKDAKVTLHVYKIFRKSLSNHTPRPINTKFTHFNFTHT